MLDRFKAVFMAHFDSNPLLDLLKAWLPAKVGESLRVDWLGGVQLDLV